MLQLSMACDQLPPSAEELQSKNEFTVFSKALQSMGGSADAKLETLKLALTGDFFLNCEQAEELLKQFSDHATAKAALVEQFLPQMATSGNFFIFILQRRS